MRTILRSTACAIVGMGFLIPTVPALGGDEPDARVKALEEQMAKLQKELADLKADRAQAHPSPPAPADVSKGVPIEVYFKNGLKFRSTDGEIDMALGGYVIENARFFTQSNPGSDTFYNKATVLNMKGRLSHRFSFEAEGLLSGAGGSTLNNSFVEYDHAGAFALRIGQFKEPFLWEETLWAPWRDFAEPSVADRLAPSRDVGIMAFGKLWETRVGYEIGYFNGQGRNANDGNDDKDLAGRLTFNPFMTDQGHPLQKLQILGQGTWGRQNGGALPAFSTPDTGTTFLTLPAATTVGEDRTRYGGGMLWAKGPLNMKGEFITMRADLVKGTLENADTRFDAWYLSAGYILTGEEAVIGGPVTPKRPMGKSGGIGAWEVAARFSGFRAEREPFYNLDKQFASSPQPTDTGTGSSTTVDAWIAGVHWTPISNAKVFLEYGENSFGADYIGPLGADVRKRERYALLSTQINF